MRLIPENALTSDILYNIDPLPGEFAEVRAIQTGANGIERTVGVNLMARGRVLEKMRFVTWRPADSPIIDPDIKAVSFCNLYDFLHYIAMTIPIRMGEHMNDQVKMMLHNIPHIRLYMS
jgi:hypothetical protein